MASSCSAVFHLLPLHLHLHLLALAALPDPALAALLLTPLSPPLLSPTSLFSLGFLFSPSSPDQYYIGTWYTHHDHSVVWIANQGYPVSGSTASLTLAPDGVLVLSNSSFTAWQAPAAGQQGVASAQILDNGNFVLLNSSGASIWESFDNPTDTLLPGQPFEANTTLSSRDKTTDYATGSYSLGFDNNGKLQLFHTKANIDLNLPTNPVYWSVGPLTEAYDSWELKFNQSGVLSFGDSKGVNTTFIPADIGSNSTRRLTLDVDGNLRMYSWEQSSNSWVRVWSAFGDPCSRITGLCGDYGICFYNPEPTCVCPPGFKVVDDNDLSGGCAADDPLFNACNSTNYLVLDNTDYPKNSFANITGISVTECKQRCSADCDCRIAVYWQSSPTRCWLKELVINGLRPPTLEMHDTIAFLKVADPSIASASDSLGQSVTRWSIVASTPNTPSIADGGHRIASNKVVILLFSVIVAQLLCFGAVSFALFRRSAKKLRQSKLLVALEGIFGSPVIFSYQDLQVATSNFSHILGSGGFGRVYKGILTNGRVIAVKRLEGVSERESQFRAEIATIGQIHHINLLRLYGFCAEGDHRLLVLEYLENGSLDSFLFHPSRAIRNRLDWKDRVEICLGSARGIAYLHDECSDCILHCDIKPQNILLDKNFRPKVADFGLAYLFSRDHTVSTSTVRGTRGYLAPEWISHLPITAKADVFSFGMLLFEIVSGRTNYSFTSSAVVSESWCFPMWAFQHLRKGTLKEVIDPSLMEAGNVDEQQAEIILKVAFCCIQHDMNLRPAMARVVQMLEGTVPAPAPVAPNLFADGSSITTPHSLASGSIGISLEIDHPRQYYIQQLERSLE